MDAIKEIVREESIRHSDSIDDALDAVEARATKLPAFKHFVSDLVRSALRSMIADFRHNENVSIKRDSGGYGGPAKVFAGKAVSRVATSYYSYFIAGRTLGNVLGEELDVIAKSESQRAEGHRFNAHLCKRLSKVVPAGKMVRKALSERKLKKIFEELQGGDS